MTIKKQFTVFGAILSSMLSYAQIQPLFQENFKSSQIGNGYNRLSNPDGSLQIGSTESIVVRNGSALTVKSEITNLGDGLNFTVESDANLIQINDLAVNKGNIRAEREFKIDNARKQYNYVGTPVNFQSGESYKTIFPGSTSTPVLYYNENNNIFYISSGVNIPGRGSAVKEPPITTPVIGGKSTAQFKGVPQNGEIKINISNKDINVDTYGYNLVGNPFPSDIDLQQLYNINGGKTGVNGSQIVSPNISPTFYFWNNEGNTLFQQQGSNYSGQAYAMFNVLTGPTGTGTQSSLSAKVPSNVLKVGQGFMTRSLISNYDFKFNNSLRTKVVPAVDFLGRSATNTQIDRYWLEMKAPSGITSTIAIVHYDGGNDLYGPEDSKTMGGSDAIYSIVENEKLAIDGRKTFDNSEIIPLGTQNFVSGDYTLSINDTEGIFAGIQDIYLKDKKMGTITNLSSGSYTFAIGAGENSGRFEIIYQPEAVLTTDAAIKEELVVYKDQGDFVIKAQTKKITSIEVYDTSGKLIYKAKPDSTKTVISGEKLVNGVYVLKIDQNGEVSSRKIIR